VADKGFPAPEKRATPITANPNAKLAFGSAVVLLFLSGLASVFTFANLQRSERRVDHSHTVQITLAKLASAAARAGRARMGYVLTRSEKFLPEYETNVALLTKLIQNLTELTRDNPVQRANCQRLGEFTTGRLRMWDETVKSAKNGQLTPVEAIATEQVSSFGAQIAALTDVMNAEESRLLAERENIAALHFRIVILVLALAFAGSLLLFFVHYQLLRNELDQRRAAETTAIKSQQAARNLSVNLMRLQDEERRKFSRELHDSLGQYLVALKMNLGQIKASGSQAKLFAEALQLTDEALSEARTLSYLLHPPILDEAGFASASQWFIEGFSRRSGINVEIDLPKNPVRLPNDVELTLFRVLQEALTNVHKHSKSKQAHVSVSCGSGYVTLMISDAGKGIPREQLSRLREDGSEAGVGLSGMRERVQELGGNLKIESRKGTKLIVTIPIATEVQAKQQAAEPNTVQPR
jgi:signal transduction histidine kinase